jgi:hypothetical protein
MICEEDNDKYAAEYFERMLKRQFEAGDKSVLLFAIYACLELRRPMPEWLRIAFCNACEAAEGFEIKSWDEVFGPPVPKGTHLNTERRNAAVRFFIVKRVQALKAEKPIDKGLFEKIGQELNPPLSGTTVSEIYYDERNRELREMIHSLNNSEDL